MLTDNQQKFLDALRSGKYVQGFGKLRSSEDGFCCLGVACDVYHQETGYGVWILVDDISYSFLGEEAVMPLEVCEWLLNSDTNCHSCYPEDIKLDTNPVLKSGGKVHTGLTQYHEYSAAELNDGIPSLLDSHNFLQIADLFEDYFNKINA